MTWDQGMNALDQVHMNCPWSAIYDINNVGVYIAVDNNFDDIAYTDLENFEFTLYVGMDDVPLDQSYSLRIYPNPCSDVLHIVYHENTGDNILAGIKSGKVKIYNLSGQVVMESSLFLHEETWFDVSLLPEGQYIIQLQDENISVARKFLIVD